MAVLFVVAVLVLLWLLRQAESLWWRPRQLERVLRAQGLNGTRYRFLFGEVKDAARVYNEANSTPMPLSHDIVPRAAAIFHRSIQLYGKMHFTWKGPTPQILISDPDMIKEILSTKFSYFEKSTNAFTKLLVQGLVDYNGEKWAKHRKIVNPAFHTEKIKAMFPAFSTCCSELTERWVHNIGAKGSCELDIWAEFQKFTGDVISQTAFGSSFEEGRRIFQLQTEQTSRIVQNFQTLNIPGYRFLPTENNLKMKANAREVREILRGIINKREKAIKEGTASFNDLLGMLMESNMNEQHENSSSNSSMTTDDMIEECKLFYFAGQETTSVLLTFTMIVLSMHPSWQVRAREEVLEVFGKDTPHKDGLSHLKTMTMILNEVLRLYPPGIILTRSVSKTINLGGLTLPKGVNVILPIISIQHDQDVWGEDANEFKPERFAEGITYAAKNQGVFLAFSSGPRVCLGQRFAMTEAKMALSMILQHFSFELSPSYVHAPCTVITLQPQHGAPLILHKLQ